MQNDEPQSASGDNEQAAARIATLHVPVLLAESLHYLEPVAQSAALAGEPCWFIDCTLGLGGHTEQLLLAAPNVYVLGIDRDQEALELARQRLAKFGERVRFVHADYRQLKAVVEAAALPSIAGILVDFGISSLQLDTPERGFSFRAGLAGQAGLAGRAGRNEAPSAESSAPAANLVAPLSSSNSSNPPEYSQDYPLDMRMDRSGGETAAHFVNTLSESELADLIFQYGEERAARRIARFIVQARQKAPLTTTAQLAELVVRAVQQKGYWRIHPATRTFQALRIAVNRELEGLAEFIADAISLLAPGGRLVILTFHSLEDRIVKQSLRYQSGQCRCPNIRLEWASQRIDGECCCGAMPHIEILTRKAVPPGEQEIAQNARARSAKLRACRKLTN